MESNPLEWVVAGFVLVVLGGAGVAIVFQDPSIAAAATSVATDALQAMILPVVVLAIVWAVVKNPSSM